MNGIISIDESQPCTASSLKTSVSGGGDAGVALVDGAEASIAADGMVNRFAAGIGAAVINANGFP